MLSLVLYIPWKTSRKSQVTVLVYRELFSKAKVIIIITDEPGLGIHTFNFSTQEAEADRPVSSSPVWSKESFSPVQPIQ